MRRVSVDPIRLALDHKAEGKRPKGRPKRTWTYEEDNLKTRRLRKEDTLKRDSWRSAIQGRPPTSFDWDRAKRNDDDQKQECLQTKYIQIYNKKLVVACSHVKAECKRANESMVIIDVSQQDV